MGHGTDSGAGNAVRARSRAVAGHTVIELRNERLTLVLAPRLGGRILSMRLDGREFLYRSDVLLDEECGAREPAAVGPHGGEMADWRNWGGDKTWPAPQGWSGPAEWAGPPDPVLDSGAYRAEIERHPGGERVSVRMTSGADPRTGLRLRREISLDAGHTGFRLRLTGVNTADRPVRWALWNITQLPGHPAGGAGDGVWVGLGGPETPVTPVTPLVAGTGTPRVEQAGPRLAQVPPQEVVGKVGFPGASGWIAHAGPAGTWAHRFPVEPGAAYPDQGSRAEVWLEHPLSEPLGHLGGLRPTRRIVECEVLGPLVELAPGEEMELDTAVQLGPNGGAVTEVGPAGYWNRPLRAEPAPGGGAALRLSGRLVPCTGGGEQLSVRVRGKGDEDSRIHPTGVPVRAGEPLDLDILPPLPGLPGECAGGGAAVAVDVLLGAGEDARIAGTAPILRGSLGRPQ